MNELQDMGLQVVPAFIAGLLLLVIHEALASLKKSLCILNRNLVATNICLGRNVISGSLEGCLGRHGRGDCPVGGRGPVASCEGAWELWRVIGV